MAQNRQSLTPESLPCPTTVPAVRVSLFVTCVVDLFTPDVGAAAVKVLRAAGCQVSCPSGQVCCGQPAWNSGFAREAAAVARTSLDALEADGADAVVAPAGSCVTMMRVFWPELFETVDDHAAADRARRLAARTFELTELLATRPPLPLTPIEENVAYHHSCHMLRELRVHDEPEALLAAAGCRPIEWVAATRCCGFGGLFSFKLPETSTAMADDKLQSLPSGGPTAVVGSDGSCLLHLRARAEREGVAITTRHIAEVLSERLPVPSS
jgi:L-lactate dehydrogenase complex protein LldE